MLLLSAQDQRVLQQQYLIEGGTIGGTCVNVGCVPSKYIISEAFSGSTWSFFAGAFRDNGKKSIRYTRNGEEKIITAEQIVFAAGRTGNTESLNLSAAGVKTDTAKHIHTNEYLGTSNPDIYAAGDVCATPGLVYVAAKEGQTAVSNAFSPAPVPLSYHAVPHVIFTHPQIARVGMTEREAENAGIHTAASRFPMEETPYGMANNDPEGTIILVKNADTNMLIGAEIMAKDAGNMIQTLTVAIMARMSTDDLINTYFPYLTAVEGIKLGTLVFNKDIQLDN